jgi:hypothetical protein
MSTQAQTGPDPSMTMLVTGIINDAQDLLKQQSILLKHELRNDIRQTKEAATSLVTGGVVSFVGLLLLSLMLVHLLNWIAPSWPLWTCYALVGGLVTAAGLIAAYAGLQKFHDLNPLPEQSVQAMKENLQWTTTRNSFGSR